MKRKIACILLAGLLIGTGGCGNKSESPGASSDGNVESSESKADTKGTMLAAVFKSEIDDGSSMEETVNTLADKSGYECGTMECSEGFLNGFSDEVSGFKTATMFSPYIGTIPFVGYVFETDEPEKLKETLSTLADPRWNICTEAEETVIEIADHYVFFVMCPGEDF
ncbi:MAG: hypothetical protein ACI4EO_09980 [Blautia sp.]